MRRSGVRFRQGGFRHQKVRAKISQSEQEAVKLAREGGIVSVPIPRFAIKELGEHLAGKRRLP